MHEYHFSVDNLDCLADNTFMRILPVHGPSPRRRAVMSGAAFSLMELLIVIGVIALLAALAIPAYNTIGRANNLTRAASDLSALLKLARTEAVARQTYVWVGVEPVSGQGNSGLAIGAVFSRDGTGTHTAPANLGPLTEVVRLSGVSWSNWSELKTATRQLYANGTPASLLTNDSGVNFKIGNDEFSGHTITFTPRGEALLKGNASPDDGFVEAIDISMRQARGNAVNADEAAVIVEGATGAVKTARVQ